LEVAWQTTGPFVDIVILRYQVVAVKPADGSYESAVAPEIGEKPAVALVVLLSHV